MATGKERHDQTVDQRGLSDHGQFEPVSQRAQRLRYGRRIDVGHAAINPLAAESLSKDSLTRPVGSRCRELYLDARRRSSILRRMSLAASLVSLYEGLVDSSALGFLAM